MHNDTLVKVWDLPVRLFHWTLATSFFIAYITEDHWLGLHTFAGYTITGLIAFRLIWGLIGSRYARFSDFVRKPSDIKQYIKDIFRFRARRYLGHNPAGGAMVIALLISLIITVITGMATYGGKELAGPLASLMMGLPEFVMDAFEELHEFFANFTLLLVMFHVAGVVLASLQHGENLIRSMFTGKKAVE
ncbi:MAG: cytochrome B [Gammaproteobacteria bacterium]|nr:MAG: cytochrome B [Gammaproteobacteria bacterium]